MPRSREQTRGAPVGVFARNELLKQLVQEKLQLQWSPEQIAGWLWGEHPDRPEWHVCYETFYQGIYLCGERSAACVDAKPAYWAGTSVAPSPGEGPAASAHGAPGWLMSDRPW